MALLVIQMEDHLDDKILYLAGRLKRFLNWDWHLGNVFDLSVKLLKTQQETVDSM